nr:hypothetical protein [Tanacetum cinerariifolium]
PKRTQGDNIQLYSRRKKGDNIQSYNDSDAAVNQDSRLNITNIANEDSNNEGGVETEERSSAESENLLQTKSDNWVNTSTNGLHLLISSIEQNFMDPVTQALTPPSHSVSSQQGPVSNAHRELANNLSHSHSENVNIEGGHLLSSPISLSGQSSLEPSKTMSRTLESNASLKGSGENPSSVGVNVGHGVESTVVVQIDFDGKYGKEFVAAATELMPEHGVAWSQLSGESRLSLLFPRLHVLETVKECMVADKLQGSFSLSFRRAVRGGAETQQFEQLQLLVDTVILSNVDDQPIATRWLKTVPIKVYIFAWKLHNDRLPTRANLVRRGLIPRPAMMKTFKICVYKEGEVPLVHDGLINMYIVSRVTSSSRMKTTILVNRCKQRKTTLTSSQKVPTKQKVSFQDEMYRCSEINGPFNNIPSVNSGKSPYERSILAFFSGKIRGPIRVKLFQNRGNNEDKWLTGAIYGGCVPVIIKDQYVFPYSDVPDWSQFSVQVPVDKIPDLKRILLEIPFQKYIEMQKRVLEVQQHFRLNLPAKQFDVFHMIFHPVWLRRLNVQLTTVIVISIVLHH